MSEFKVFVADSMSKEGLGVFDQYPEIEVIFSPGLKGDELKEAVRSSDATLIRSSSTIDADILSQPGKCKVIGRAGIGVDNVDIPAATANGVIVMNTPGGNSVTTAEHSIAMLFAVARTLPQAHAKLAQGNWDKKAHTGAELFKKTLGIVGLGNIGRIVADRARGLHMNLIGYDPFMSAERAAEIGVELVDLEEIWKRSDFITLHVPLTDETKNMISTEQFAMMKPTARVVNCARGGIIDEDALVKALDDEQIAGAALDVFASEPLDPGSPLVGHPKMITTPHLGASTVEAQVNVAVQVAEQVAEFLLRGDIRNAVNAPALDGETVQKLGAHIALGRSLGLVHRQLLPGATDKVTIRFAGDFVRFDTEPIVRQVLVGLLDKTVEQPVNVINVREIANRRGIEVQVSQNKKGGAYSESIEVDVSSGDQAHSVLGAVFGDNESRIVRFDDYQLEGIEPKGVILAVQNADEPGVVGAVGAFLGTHNINIARLQVSRNRNDGQAMMFVQVDQNVSDDVLDGLGNLAAVQSVKLLML